MRAIFAGVLCLLHLCGLAAASTDSIPALNFDHANPVGGTVFPRGEIWSPTGTHGHDFLVTEAVRLTHLSIYDDGADGLLGSYRIGLWGPGGSRDDGLIVEAEVASGSDAELSGSWRLADVPDIVLEPGNYTVGAVLVENAEWVVEREACENSPFPLCEVLGIPEEPPVPVDQYYWLLESDPIEFAPLTNDPRISYQTADGVSPLFSSGSGFMRPDLGLLVIGAFVGPTVFVEPIPEPSAALLGLITLACLVSIHRGA